ncbi:MAG: hypothetical protein IJQ26_07315, partial [Lachnospiraceae bacterium]|nr:hypothetical protein [Lachnospiraceae bacterium]
MGLLTKLVGTHSERELKRIESIVQEIEAKRPYMMSLSDAQLRAQTASFKSKLAGGKTLDDILPEAYATVREAARRVFQIQDPENDEMYGKRRASDYDSEAHGMEHFRVQLIGGIVLHQGRIAEMRTGEGKTLVA